ncbi:hypothetical protein C8R46DRAFT_1218292 [Mycena filopes]|nr:hypothetical protein C8R46DRAFT_1218292 [Mycena filopes]
MLYRFLLSVSTVLDAPTLAVSQAIVFVAVVRQRLSHGATSSVASRAGKTSWSAGCQPTTCALAAGYVFRAEGRVEVRGETCTIALRFSVRFDIFSGDALNRPDNPGNFAITHWGVLRTMLPAAASLQQLR